MKAFESFQINENDSAVSDIEQTVTQKVENLSDEDKEQVKNELSELANKLGLSLEDMTDTNKVGEALAKNQGSLGEVSESLNEGLSDWWGRVKQTFFKWLTRLGVMGMIGGITSAAIGAHALEIGAHALETATTLADFVPDSVVEPNTAIIMGGVALAISLAATLVGLQKGY
jgi:ABC-type transporter Mla subunit MlaD